MSHCPGYPRLLEQQNICATMYSGSTSFQRALSQIEDPNLHHECGPRGARLNRLIALAIFITITALGQWVWLFTWDFRLTLPSRKLRPRSVGPFKVSRQITVLYRLALPSNYYIPPTFHVSLLKPAGGSRGEEVQDETSDQGPPPIIMDGEEVYQVNEPLDSTEENHYNTLWTGRGMAQRSGPGLTQDILNPSLIADFHRAHLDRPAPRPRGPRPR